MDKPKLEHWKEISDILATSKSHPYVNLSLDAGGYGLNCNVYPDGRIRIMTHTGGGHGEGTYNDPGRSHYDWMMLLEEAVSVKEHYWGAE